jgi:hypothetical protein
MVTKWNNVGEESEALCMATVGVSANGTVFPIRCKRWSCPICAPINALREAIKTANGVNKLRESGLVSKFATVTQPGSIKSPEFAYSIIDNQWDKFRNRWQYWAKKVGLPNMYAAFVEGQSRRSDMPHFHIIGTSLPGSEAMKKWAVKSGFGFEADVQDIQPNSGIAWYVSKYSTKGSDAQYIPKGFRRVRYSQDWPKMEWRSDALEGEAIVRMPRETYPAWIIRAVRAFGIDPTETMNQVMLLADKTIDDTKADYAAKSLMLIEHWE